MYILEHDNNKFLAVIQPMFRFIKEQSHVPWNHVEL